MTETRTKVAMAITEVRALCTDHWNDIPRPMYRDIARATALHMSYRDETAWELLRPALHTAHGLYDPSYREGTDQAQTEITQTEGTMNATEWTVKSQGNGLMDMEQAREIAAALYSHVDGADDVEHRDTVLTEMVDWLREGDFSRDATIGLDDLAAAWVGLLGAPWAEVAE